MVRIMILPNVKDVVSIILTMKMMILCCVITVKSAGIMGLSQLDFEDLRGYAIMIKVLFICHGNICRSPMAEFVMKKLVSDANFADHFQIASAATSSEEIWNGTGNPIYPPAQAELRKHGIGKTAYTNFSKKRARQVTKEDYGYYDYLLCADANNIKNTIRITGPDVDGKIKLLLDFAADPKRKGKSISDPWYSGRFDETYQDVVSGCEGLLAYLKETGQI